MGLLKIITEPTSYVLDKSIGSLVLEPIGGVLGKDINPFDGEAVELIDKLEGDAFNIFKGLEPIFRDFVKVMKSILELIGLTDDIILIFVKIIRYVFELFSMSDDLIELGLKIINFVFEDLLDIFSIIVGSVSQIVEPIIDFITFFVDIIIDSMDSIKIIFIISPVLFTGYLLNWLISAI